MGQTFDLGNVYSTGENIKTARQNRNVLASQEQRSQAKFSQEQQLENTRRLYSALTEISQNPVAADRLVPQLKEMGIMRGDFDYSKMSPEEIQSTAAEGARSIKAGLDAYMQAGQPPSNMIGKYNPGDYTPQSWAANTSGNNVTNPAGLERYESPKQDRIIVIDGVPTRVTTTPGVNQPPQPLSNIEKTSEAESIISGAKETGKLQAKIKWEPMIKSAVKKAELLAAEKGEVFTDLKRAEAAMPGLEATVASLKELAPKATDTIAGTAWDFVVKQTGFGATSGATAKARFISIVTNQVLPLLRPTFGAAFTKAEGEKLEAAMADPNATAEEKIAQLTSFIEQKYRDIQTKKTQLESYPDESTEQTINWSDL